MFKVNIAGKLNTNSTPLQGGIQQLCGPNFTPTPSIGQNLTFYIQQARRKWGAGGALALPVFDQTVNPISTRGADYAHHSNPSPTPDFQTLRRPCQ